MILRLAAVGCLTLATAGPGPWMAGPQLASPVFLAQDGSQLDLGDEEAVLDFLARARIVDAETTEEGITRPLRVVLEHGGHRFRGIFRHVDEQHRIGQFSAGPRVPFFRDRAVFEVAAYRLSRLLGLDHVPPTVRRSHDRQEGSLQLWIELATNDRQRRAADREDPSAARWNRQLATMNVFDQLIGNDDRNQTNMLIDSFWRLWLIDHTRGFRGSAAVRVDGLESIERGFWERLHTVSDDQIRMAAAEFLTRRELSALLARRRALVRHFEGRIATLGEGAVLFDY